MSDQSAENKSSPKDEQAHAAEDPTAGLKREIDDLRSKVLRAHADYQNAVRRSQLSVFEAREQQVFEMAKSLVNVMDHFDMALNVDPEKVSSQTMLTGLQMVRTEMFKTLEGYGLKRLTATPGEEFNPRQHEAVMRQKVSGIQESHVAAQLQSGYAIGEKVLRPVKVSIAE